MEELNKQQLQERNEKIRKVKRELLERHRTWPAGKVEWVARRIAG
tara:strand:- start:318 stop:452 length:135 start_codon:yes stop_codon:yes gene_type:complete